MPGDVEPSTTRQTGTRSVHANRGKKSEEEKDRVSGEHPTTGRAAMAHRTTGSVEDAVGVGWKYGIRKGETFFESSLSS